MYLNKQEDSNLNTIEALPKKNNDNNILSNEILKISGYIDGAYSYMRHSNHFISGDRYINNDLNTNGFAIHQLAVNFAYEPKEGLGGVFHPFFGQDAFALAPSGWDPNIGLDHETGGISAIDAYLQYAIGSFTFYAGLLEALAGYEPLDPTDSKNKNFSRSALSSFAVPDTVTGIRGTYVFNKKINLSVGVDNGWDSINDTSRSKTVELSSTYAPFSILSISATGMSGGERAIPDSTNGPTATRNIIDIYTTINITEKLSLVGNYDYGMQTKAELPDDTTREATWQGFATYLNYQWTDQCLTSIRAEIFDDEDGYRTGVVQVWKEITLSVGYFPIKNIEIRAEARHDFSNADAFVDTDSTHTANNQQLFALEVYYKF